MSCPCSLTEAAVTYIQFAKTCWTPPRELWPTAWLYATRNTAAAWTQPCSPLLCQGAPGPLEVCGTVRQRSRETANSCSPNWLSGTPHRACSSCRANSLHFTLSVLVFNAKLKHFALGHPKSSPPEPDTIPNTEEQHCLCSQRGHCLSSLFCLALRQQSSCLQRLSLAAHRADRAAAGSSAHHGTAEV